MKRRPPKRLDQINAAAPSEIRRTDHDVARRFCWDIAAIAQHLQEIRIHWAAAIGITGPQWMIILALAELDKGQGVPVNIVAKMLHVDSSFVTTQSKILEKKGYLRRKTSPEDGRVVQMSLTHKTYKHLAQIASEREELNNFIFAELSPGEFGDLTSKLTALKTRFEKASLRVANGF
jgi:DNA-binding MarR family transcriptional regulator